eukprot:COSAG01_NODE_31071_length_604_cov_1.029703_1_plen_109_part_10
MPEPSSPGVGQPVTDVAFVAEGSALALAVAVVALGAIVHRLRRGSWRVTAAISGAKYGRAAVAGSDVRRPLKLRQYNPGRMSTMGFVTVALTTGIRATIYYSVGLWVQI